MHRETIERYFAAFNAGDTDAIRTLREGGQVRNRAHWGEQGARLSGVTTRRVGVFTP